VPGRAATRLDGEGREARKRFYIREGRHADRIVDSRGPEAAEADIGPMIHERQLERVEQQLRDAEQRGARILTGGNRRADLGPNFLEPAVVAEPAADSRLMREEVFGPVLPVLRFSDFDDVITRANDTPYGLGSSIWTHDARLIHRAAQEIDTGMTWVNQIHYGYDELPFGGIKASGFGKEHGLEALDSYVEIKSVVVGGLAS